MRSTAKKGPRTRAVKLIHAAHPTSIESRVSRALYSAVSTAQVINTMWQNAPRKAGDREPPEPEPTTQIAPTPPLRPADGAARPIAITTLKNGTSVLDVGDETLRLSAEESRVLRKLFSRSTGCAA